jgi:hypothetical protein
MEIQCKSVERLGRRLNTIDAYKANLGPLTHKCIRLLCFMILLKYSNKPIKMKIFMYGKN